MKLKLLFVLVLMLAVALFTLQNATVITLRFILWEFPVSQALVILLSAIFGALIGLAVGALAGRTSQPAPPASTPPEPAAKSDRT